MMHKLLEYINGTLTTSLCFHLTASFNEDGLPFDSWCFEFVGFFYLFFFMVMLVLFIFQIGLLFFFIIFFFTFMTLRRIKLLVTFRRWYLRNYQILGLLTLFSSFLPFQNVYHWNLFFSIYGRIKFINDSSVTFLVVGMLSYDVTVLTMFGLREKSDAL